MKNFYFKALAGWVLLLGMYGGQQLIAQTPSSPIRISQHGPDGDPNLDAFDPDLAYNDNDDEFLVVWAGDTLNGRNDVFAIVNDNVYWLEGRPQEGGRNVLCRLENGQRVDVTPPDCNVQ